MVIIKHDENKDDLDFIEDLDGLLSIAFFLRGKQISKFNTFKPLEHKNGLKLNISL
jgi:hypothetical protein